jgi:transcriptional regulator with PAS, ATPase and Fis domain
MNLQEPLIVGKSAAIRELHYFTKIAAKSVANVLILGETGVGKELAAKAIHCRSNRKEKPFVKINCGNLNENLVESELFGHRRGSFTGAFIDKPGLIEAANGGTFFFDEIGDISMGLQAKLLSVIEDKEIRRIGENYNRSVDTRFIFATNKDLSRLIAKGKFREDLFYRVNILTLYIPPLRERRMDIPILIESIMEKASLGRAVKLELTKAAIRKTCEYSFPGNVRELENVLTRACALSSSARIDVDDIIFHQSPRMNSKFGKHKHSINSIVDVLVKCSGNKTEAAKALGISRVHLYRMLKF